MKIEKTECSYHVTECDFKFGEQITLGGELLIPTSALDKIRAEIEQLKHQNTDVSGYRWWNNAIDNCLHEINALKAESEG